MRKFILIILTAIIVCSLNTIALGSNVANESEKDLNIAYESLSDEALQNIILRARLELIKRDVQALSENTTIVDCNGIQVIFLGTYNMKEYSEKYVYMDCVIINENDFKVSFSFENIHINGWSHIDHTGLSSVEANGKAKESIGFSISDAMLENVNELEDLNFTILVRNEQFEAIISQDVNISFEGSLSM